MAATWEHFGPFARASTGAGKMRPRVKRRRHRQLVAAAMVLPVIASAAWQTARRSQTSSASSTAAAGPPSCGVFHPVVNVPPSVPVLGFGAVSLGWGTAHPLTFSNGGEASGTVWCITWKHWGAASSYGQGWSEIYGPANTRPTVRIEIRAFDLGHCRSGGHLAYKDLAVKEPHSPGGSLGAWSPWGPTGRICQWPRPMIASH